MFFVFRRRCRRDLFMVPQVSSSLVHGVASVIIAVVVVVVVVGGGGGGMLVVVL